MASYTPINIWRTHYRHHRFDSAWRSTHPTSSSDYLPDLFHRHLQIAAANRKTWCTSYESALSDFCSFHFLSFKISCKVQSFMKCRFGWLSCWSTFLLARLTLNRFGVLLAQIVPVPHSWPIDWCHISISWRIQNIHLAFDQRHLANVW